MSRDNFIPKNETLLGNKLRKLLPDRNTRKKVNPSKSLPPLTKIGEDGVDHINMWDRANTDIGKLLGHGTELPFKHSIFNRFLTIEGFWNYIRSEERDPRLRKLSGKLLRKCVTYLTFIQVTNFKAIIMDANWQKISQYPELAEALKESVLPLDCYFIYRREDGIRERPQYAYWVIDGFNEIRLALKENREPNFDFLKDDKSKGIYDAVMNVKKKEVKAEESTFSENSNSVLGALLRNNEPKTEKIFDIEDVLAEETVVAETLPEAPAEISIEVSSNDETVVTE